MFDDEIKKAVELLLQGELVAFPTETVYGLGGDALNPKALEKIYQAKGRPANHPLIMHIDDVAQLEKWAVKIPDFAWQLAEKFWPGPMTLILTKSLLVPFILTGGQETVGIRIPSHPLARQLLRSFGRPIAAPSANRFGFTSPTTAQHVKSEFQNQVVLILEGGACEIGIESTIIDATKEQPQILRPGSITATEVQQVTGVVPAKNSPRVSGALANHYAPQTPLLIVPTKDMEKTVSKIQQMQKTCILLAFKPPSLAIDWIGMPPQATKYAQELYAKIRIADGAKMDFIIVEEVPMEEEWLAVRDRLQKAADKITKLVYSRE